jgi:DNA-binding LacI/PurR family transcriptional regulator
MNTDRVTLHDVARQLGVSHTTVAMALKNHPRISKDRREQVQKMAEKMGYQPDPFLSGLAAYRRRKHTAKFQGVIAWVNHMEQPERMRGFREFDEYWQGAKDAAARFGYQLEDIRWPVDCSAKGFERILLARGIPGLLIPPHPPGLNWSDFDWSKFSLVRFGMSVRNPDSNLVTSDQHRAVVMAVTRIRDYGYQRIGLVADPDFERSLGGNYYGAFCWAQRLLELDPVLPPHLVRNELYRGDPAKELRALERWLDRHRPDALLTPMAPVPAMLQKLGYRIPKDVAVAGTSVLDLPLDAGIDQHSRAIGRIGVEMLVKQIHVNERGEPSDPCRILVESTWRDGKSLPRRRQS